MPSVADTQYPAEREVELTLRLKVAITPPLFRGDWQQRQFDVNWFSHVVMRLAHAELAQQYAKQVALARQEKT